MKTIKKSARTKMQIDALERKLRRLRKKQKEEKNKETSTVAKKFVKDLKRRATPAEMKFMSIANAKGINLIFQYPVYICVNGVIEKFYIADFCDKEHRIIIEVDGGYHYTPEQTILDESRTEVLKKHRYSVFRISNEDVFNGKSTAFLYEIYKRIGIDITSH